MIGITYTQELLEVSKILQKDPCYTRNREKAKEKCEELQNWLDKFNSINSEDQEYETWLPEKLHVPFLICQLDEYIGEK